MEQINSDNEEEILNTSSPIPSASLSCYLKNAITNIAYNIKHCGYLNIPGIFQQNISFNKNDHSAYILGKKYSYETFQEFNKHFQNTIWFSYRKNIPGIGNDTGWGCMIRSVMMMIAEALQRTKQMTIWEILSLFQGKQLLSLSSICKAGQISSIQLIQIKDGLHLIRYQSSVPILLKTMRRNLILIQSISIHHKINQSPEKNTLLAFQIQTGFQSFDTNYGFHLKQIMKCEYFCGVLGGVPGNAMYIIGYKDDNVIGLDPHYVQDETNPQQYYFKQYPRGLNLSKLSPSISIGFIIRNNEEYHNLVKYLFKVEKYIDEYKIISLLFSSSENKQLVEQSNEDTEIRSRKQSDDFQLLE